MRNRLILALAFSFFPLVLGTGNLPAQVSGEPDRNPTGDTGALKAQVLTAGSYDAHSGNATRSITDLSAPGAVGDYGLNLVRYWNSLRNDRYQANSTYEPDQRTDFGAPGWSHSWGWSAVYTPDIQEPFGDGGQQIYISSITITFPDGHANKYKISRTNTWPVGQPWAPDPRCGPPYYAERHEDDWQGPSGAVGDHLMDMDYWGESFWLHLADGGAVHFQNVYGNNVSDYRATEVFDPHGLRTELHYDGDLNLQWVQQDGGRRLTFRWDSICDGPGQCWSKVIGQVKREGSEGQQVVDYRYSRFDHPQNGSWLTLTSVIYQNDQTLGRTARYTYWADYTPPEGFFVAGPMLATANDPRFDGPLKSIRYDYSGTGCSAFVGMPPPQYNNGEHDYFLASPTAVAAEREGRTGGILSRFVINCFGGTRLETNGFGLERMFYFGHSATWPQSGAMGYQLAKLTDFYPPNNGAGAPSRRQSYLNGHPRHSWDGRGIATQFTHTDATGFPSEIKHVGSDQSTYRYNRVDDGTSEPRDVTRVPNTDDRWLFSKTDERIQTTRYIRDSRRRVKRIEHPDGSFEVFGYDSTLPVSLNRVTSHRLASGATVHYEYDNRGLLQREWNDVDTFAEHTSYEYYGGQGNHPEWTDLVKTVLNCRARTNGQQFSAKMEYNGRYQITKVTYPPAVAGGAESSVTYNYDSSGNCTSIKNELGHTSYYLYDVYGRCITYIEPLNAPDHNGTGNVAYRQWDWRYDRKIGGNTHAATSHTSKDWAVQIDPVFNAAGQRRVTAREFDLQNRIVAEQTGWIQPPGEIGSGNPWYPGPDLETHRYTYDENGQKQTFTDPRDRVTHYEYDQRNRLKKTIEPANRITETSYDTTGNKTLVKFPDNTTQQWLSYDAFGQPWQFKDERQNVTDLTYWPWGPMKKPMHVITHANGTETTTFWHDGLGRLETTGFPDTTSEQNTYGCGQLETWKTRRNQIKRLSYDARGREKSHFWDGGTASSITRIWDAANRLTRISNSFSMIDYKYDDAGQVWWEGNEITGGGGRRQLTYYRNPTGEVSRLTYPNGTVVDRFYTGRGQLKDVGWGAGATSYVYHPDGKVDYQARTNQVTTRYGYDGRGMISSVLHEKSGQSLASREYWRDNRDRILAWKRGPAGGPNGMENGRGDRYAYDPEGQLYQASYRALNPEPWLTLSDAKRSDSFQYDGLGNRFGAAQVASRGPMNFTRRDNGLNQYLAWSPMPVVYDDNWFSPWRPPGNGVTMGDGYITASYNALNQPMAMGSMSLGSNFYWFWHDPLGRCVKRWLGNSSGVPTGPITYLYYDGWSLVQEGPNALTADRLYVHGGRVDEIVASKLGGQWYNHQYDARGHCILLTNSGGAIQEQYDYDAFGMPYFYNAAGTSLGNFGGVGNRFLFTGREWINDLRVYDYRNRVYQPELGRFLQPDPKQFEAGDYNLYRYCHNDPVNHTDPYGLLEIRWKESGNATDPKIENHYTDEKLRANNAPAAGKTTADLSTSGNQDNSVTADLKVDWKVRRDLAEKDKSLGPREKQHADGFHSWVERMKSPDSDVTRHFADKNYASPEEAAKAVHEFLKPYLRNEFYRQKRDFDKKGGPHDVDYHLKD